MPIIGSRASCARVVQMHGVVALVRRMGGQAQRSDGPPAAASTATLTRRDAWNRPIRHPRLGIPVI
jgi:hypothetical protein